MPLFQSATYAFSVAEPGAPLPASPAEIAFAGRSNAGKSSAINTLAAHKRLAFVSKTPGRTQMINFFLLANGAFLVDLPGYGFATAPGSIRSRWDALLGGYLRSREALRGLVIVMDIRHPMTELDQRLIEFFSDTGKPIHVLLTKADKLSHAAAQAALQAVRAELARLSPAYSAQLFSSLKRLGIDQAEAVFGAWLGMEPRAETARAKAGPPGKLAAPKKKHRAGHFTQPAAGAKKTAREKTKPQDSFSTKPGARNKKPQAKGG
jgi:GTP-binding protein